MALDPRLNRIARKFEPRIRDELIKAFKQIRNLVSDQQVVDTLLSGGIEATMSLIDDQTYSLIRQSITDELDDAITASGRASITLLPEEAVLDTAFRFSMVNPRTAAFVQQYELNLIREVSSETIAAVRQGLADDIVTGRNPVATARDFRANIGLTTRQEKAVRNYRKYLEDLDTTALKRKLRDKRFDSTIRRAIRDDKPLSQSQINRMTDRYREKAILRRTQTIARTESLRATSIGNQEALDQMVSEGAVDPNTRKFWVPARDARVRDAHERIPMMNPEGVPLDGLFTTPLGPLKYPRDPAGSAANTIQCRCALIYRIHKEAK